MSCCGRQRAALRTRSESIATADVRSARSSLHAPVALAHLGANATIARGEQTGLTYLFGADGAALDVDARDAPTLLASGLFAAVPAQRPGE